MTLRLTRRQLLRCGLFAAGSAFLAACAPKQPTPVPQPETKAETAPTQKPAQPVQEVITLRFMSRQGQAGDHHREFAKRYSEESGGRIKVECEDTAWGDIPKKLETQLITGTMVDLAVMSTRYFPYLARRGAFLVIEDLVQKHNLDLSKWFIIEWFRRWTNGKLSGLGGAAGLSNLLVFYNKGWIKEATGQDLTDDWTMDDLVSVMEACVKLKGEGHFGTAIPIGGHVEADSWVCNWGSSYLDPETYTKSLFAEEKVQDSIKWTMEMLKAK
ncbi:MAG: extracellular solute-binding protein, partial [Chloroflexi bacterium]|nr:extracellular solute-binding protein [Chloroflexota bacterium]